MNLAQTRNRNDGCATFSTVAAANPCQAGAQSFPRHVSGPAVHPHRPTTVVLTKKIPTWLRLKFEIGILLAVLGMSAAFLMNPGLLDIGKWGYLSGFLINVVSTATIFLPAPGIAAIIATGAELNPFVLGVVTGLGGSLGSLTAYWAGVQGRRVIHKRKVHTALAKLMDRFGGGVLFGFSVIAFLPADFASLVAGMTRYPVRRYLFYVTAGNVVKMVLLLLLAERYLGAFMSWIGGI